VTLVYTCRDAPQAGLRRRLRECSDLLIESIPLRVWRAVMQMGLRKKVAVVFISMLVVAGLNLGLLHRMLQDFNGVAATATVAGKLRMLGQKLGYEALSVSSGVSEAYETLEHDIVDFDAAYLVLRSGGTAFNEFIQPLDSSYGPSLDAVWLARSEEHTSNSSHVKI